MQKLYSLRVPSPVICPEEATAVLDDIQLSLGRIRPVSKSSLIVSRSNFFIHSAEWSFLRKNCVWLEFYVVRTTVDVADFTFSGEDIIKFSENVCYLVEFMWVEFRVNV